MQCLVIIPAAGSGSRFGGDVPKQFLPLAGRPIIVHVVERFLRQSEVARVIIAVSPSERQRMEEQRDGAGWKQVTITEGGATRQESVHRALISAERDPRALVAVHDAVRPFFRSATFAALIRAADESGAAIPTGHLNETIHRVRDGFILETLDRSELFAAQTPQCFRIPILRRALDEAVRLRIEITDEASAVTRMGIAVRVLPGDPHNIKITRSEDLRMAEQNFEQWSAE
jgi:2-C-methyl-D-erythritol 4-phosphate cytidylyltransferase